MINNLNRSELVARGLGGGAVVIAAGSEITQSTIGSATTQYRKWFRLYSDGWCEQGGLCKDDIKEELPIPYEDTYFQVELTTYASTPPPNTGHPWWQDFDPAYTTYHSFTPHLGPDRAGGPTTWAVYVARGYVSQETFKQVLAGKGWNPVTESWGGVEYVIDLSDGTKTLTLQPGNYTLFMCGAGHNFGTGQGPSYAFTDVWSGGAGGTICAKFTLDSSVEVNASVGENGTEFYDTERNAIDLLCSNASEKIGGTNTVTTFLGTITKNVSGGNANWTTVEAGGYAWGTAVDIVNSELYKILGVNNGRSGSGTFGPNYNAATYSLGQPGLIRLLMETE